MTNEDLVCFLIVFLFNLSITGNVRHLESLQPSTPDDESERMLQLFDELLTSLSAQIEPYRQRFQSILETLAGSSFGSYEANSQLVRKLNQTRRALGLAFRLQDDNKARRIILKCANPPRSKAGSFQAVTTTSKPKVLYVGSSLPSLKIFDPE